MKTSAFPERGIEGSSLFPEELEISSRTKARPQQGMDSSVPLPTALTATPIVRGGLGAGMQDLRGCPRDRQAAGSQGGPGRSWQAEHRPGLETKASVQMKSAPTHCWCPGKPGTEFGKPHTPGGAPLFFRNMAKQTNQIQCLMLRC